MTSESYTPESYLLVDGENIDRTLGQILEHKPRPNDRPRWDAIKEYVQEEFGDCRALFFLNATRGLPGSFIQALKMAGYTPIPLSSELSDVKVVDAAIIKTLEAIGATKPNANVVLASHDADFFPAFNDIAIHGQGKVGIVGFEEYLAGSYMEMPDLRIIDLETQVKAFPGRERLPRIRVIRLEDFNPTDFL